MPRRICSADASPRATWFQTDNLQGQLFAMPARLLPTHPAVNGEKSDKLPAAALLVERRTSIVESWSLRRDAMPDAFNRQAQHLLGSKPLTGREWSQNLFARMRQAVEETALQRGVWTPRSESAT